MVTKLKQLSAAEFLAEFDADIHDDLRRIAALPGTTHLLQTQVLALDSSQAGHSTAYAVGPERTIKTLAEVEGRFIGDDLPSRRHYAVAYVPVEDLLAKPAAQPVEPAQPDVTVNNQGTIVALTLRTDEARAWVDENVPSESWQWLGENTLCIEPRYAVDLLAGIVDAGLTVEGLS